MQTTMGVARQRAIAMQLETWYSITKTSNKGRKKYLCIWIV